MSGPLHAGERWLLRPAPASHLAWFRIAVGAYGVAWLVFASRELVGLTRLDPVRFERVGAVAWLGLSPPDSATVTGLIAVTAASGVAFTAGWRYRFTAPVFAIGLLVLTSYQNSWGKLLHTENLLVVHALVLAASPAADAIAWRRRAPGPAGPQYGWPVRVMAVATVCSYAAAGATKLRVAGLDWFDPENLRNWVAYDLVRKELFGDPYVPVAIPVLEHPWVFAGPMLFTLVVELAAPIALLRRRIATVWAVAAWSLHAGILLAMSVAFPYHLTGIPLVAAVVAASSRERAVTRPDRTAEAPRRRRRRRAHPPAAPRRWARAG